jgi:hypothetical protein
MNKNLHANKLISAEDIQKYCQEYNELFTDLFNKLLVRVKDKTDDVHNFIVFVSEAIKLLSDEAVELHGYQKKEMVIDLVKGVVETMPIDDEDKEKLKCFVFPSLDNTIDLFIAAAKGYLFLQKVEDKIEEGCAKCQARCGGGQCIGCRKASHQEKKKGVNTSLAAPRDGEGAVLVENLTTVVYDRLRGMITHKQVTVSNIVAIVTLAMQLVQQYVTLTGQQKKYIVIHVINKLVAEIPMSDDDRLAVQALVSTTLDKTIDYVISVATGEVDLLGQIEETVGRCKAMCGCA